MRKLLWLAAALLTSPSLFANGRGAVVIRDNAVVYESLAGDKTIGAIALGKSVVIAGVPAEQDARLQVVWFGSANDQGKLLSGWVDRQALAGFSYDCCCGKEANDCAALDFAFDFFFWNSCYQKGRDEKLRSMADTLPPRRPAARTDPPRIEDHLQEFELHTFDGKPATKMALFGSPLQPGEHTVVLFKTSSAATGTGGQLRAIDIAFEYSTIVFDARPGYIYILTDGPMLTEMRKLGRIKTELSRILRPKPEWCAESK